MKTRFSILSLLGLASLAPLSAAVLDDSTPTNEFGWRHAPRFGWWFDYRNNWIHHEDYGVLYHVPGGPRGSYIWKPGMGWWWLSQDSYPYIYSFRFNRWYAMAKNNGTQYYWVFGWERWVSEDQLENLTALHELLAQLRSESEVTPAQLQALADALKTFKNSVELSDAAVEAFAQTLQAAWADQNLSEEERQKLSLAAMDIMATATYDEAALAALKSTALEIAAASNLDAEDLAALDAAIQAIIDEFKARWGIGNDETPATAA